MTIEYRYEGPARTDNLEKRAGEGRSPRAAMLLVLVEVEITACLSELEITDINLKYLEGGKLRVDRMGRGFAWLDTGTSQSLLEASEFVAMIERRQGLKVCCPEEIAIRLGYVTLAKLEPWLAKLGKSGYSEYVQAVCASRLTT
jgi:dTDP-glucose pyrophosphorylase